MSSTEKPDDLPAEDGAGPTDDVRERFREALARKQSKEKGVPHHPDQAGGSAHTKSAKTQRMFRRKSG
ncbi:MAG TPA: DUF5302 domain-containing protein [Jiangellaceae bacterium]|nr:DUF5302 domain-containing protein [Jiangellaceae bacterium]